ncbi:hypothetical protein [Sunxiuqinia dokdonensis]|uniref:Uncharacterized protein n=1 Tax=Sunxiuqinia dokdonensis TaxID=1409788 RepID=A0A0L8VAF3_9BACT|nr:hypothetical protein [Sunxiuqinia dokdonensis]KOH45429.1 hypothetical protein NC99_17570 [Sunxiuqinia dokdonensis]
MEDNKRWVFSKVKAEQKFSKSSVEAIHLESCPQHGDNCKAHRAVINECLKNSFEFFMQSHYDQAVNELKKAFNETLTMEQETCAKCAELFRLRITTSLEQIQQELQKMTSGFFKSNRHKPSLEYATTVINELKGKV